MRRYAKGNLVKAVAAAAVIALAFSGSIPASAAPFGLSSAQEASLDAVAAKLIGSRTTASASFAIVRGGRIVCVSAMGKRDLANDLPATPRTLYHIGSITKLFTAVSVMQLVESGAVSLDDKLSKFFPSFSSGATISIRELLTHRSGIGNYLDSAIASGSALKATTPQAIVARAESQPLQFAPGSAYGYSNTNYVMLGLIVERVSKVALGTYFARHIFAPADMTETYVGTAPPGAQLATGYALSSEESPQQPGDPSWYYACGDMLSTATDIARFDIALMAGQLLRPASLHEMIASSRPTGEGAISYGLGIMTYPLGSRTMAGHHGGLPGFEADDEMIPTEGFAVIALGNDFDFPTSALLGAALQMFYPADLALAQARDARVSAMHERPPLTQRFTSFIEGVISGRMDAENLTDTMAGAMTPQAVSSIAAGYAPLGKFERLTFVSDDEQGEYHRYHYEAIFTGGAQPMTFVLDARQKLAGFFNI